MKHIAITVALGVFMSLSASAQHEHHGHKNHKKKEEKPISKAKELIRPEFQLKDYKGVLKTHNDFKGSHMLIFFGYTYCPTICPMGLLNITKVSKKLNAMGKKTTPIFITVDPSRDTKKRLAKYIPKYGKGLLGFTGSEKEIKKVADNFRVYYGKIPNPKKPEDYQLDHSTQIYLIDTQGKYVAHFSSQLPEKEFEDKVMAHFH